MAALGTRLLKIKLGATERTAEMSKAVVTSAKSDSDFQTFADTATGGARDYFLEMEAVQDLAASTLWDLVFTSPGTTVAVVLNPYGVATATATTPFLTGNVVVAEPDGDFIGGEADDSSSARMTFEGKWAFTAKPTRVTTGSF